jgi:hypothetical protein
MHQEPLAARASGLSAFQPRCWPTVDAPPGHPGSVTIAGPTFDPEELAGRKLLAPFDRAAARDFVDIYLLAQRFPRNCS